MDECGYRCGLFAFRIEHGADGIRAVLTGDHFGYDEHDIARSVVRTDSLENEPWRSSPMYLVRDSVVSVAMIMYDSDSGLMLSECHDGPCGKPCGKCPICRRARSDAFTRILLGGMETDGPFFASVKEAVSSVIGMSSVDAPWVGPMTDDQVNEVFVKTGVHPAKE